MFDKSYELLLGTWNNLLTFEYLSWIIPVISFLSVIAVTLLPIILLYLTERILRKVVGTRYKVQHLLFKIAIALQVLWGSLAVTYMYHSLTGG